MRAKDFIPASKPRNFVAKNQKTGGSGAHKDKKKAEKQGYEKHKNKVDETELRNKDDLQAKRKALQDLQMDPNSSDPEIKQAIMQRKADLEKEAKAKGLSEYGDTAKGQKMLTKVQKRATDRMIKADDNRDPKAAKKNSDTAKRAWDRFGEKEKYGESRHGYDDSGMSLAPGHDEGEPVYNPRYDRTGQYDRKAKYSQDYNYNTGKPLGAPSEKKGFIFYNVNDPQTAENLGLKQTKSGKWYLPTGNRFAQKTADKVFGAGKIWYPKD